MTPSKSGGAPSRAPCELGGAAPPKCTTVWMLTPSWSTTFRNASSASSWATRTGIGPPPTMWLSSPGCVCPRRRRGRSGRSPDPGAGFAGAGAVRACARRRRRRARRVDTRRPARASRCATRGRSRGRDGSRTRRRHSVATRRGSGSCRGRSLQCANSAGASLLRGQFLGIDPLETQLARRVFDRTQARRARQRRAAPASWSGHRGDLARLGE